MSLVELVIVISIMAVLGGVAMLSISGLTRRAQETKALSDAEALNRAMHAYEAGDGRAFAIAADNGSANDELSVVAILRARISDPSGARAVNVADQFISTNTVAQALTAAQVASDLPRVVWDGAAFAVSASPGAHGILLREDADAAAADAPTDRDFNLAKAVRDPWIWDYTESPVPERPVPPLPPGPNGNTLPAPPIDVRNDGTPDTGTVGLSHTDFDCDALSGSPYVTVAILALSGYTEGTEYEIRYTLDGSDPTAASPLYSGPFEVPISSMPATVKARAFSLVPAYTDSPAASVLIQLLDLPKLDLDVAGVVSPDIDDVLASLHPAFAFANPDFDPTTEFVTLEVKDPCGINSGIFRGWYEIYATLDGSEPGPGNGYPILNGSDWPVKTHLAATNRTITVYPSYEWFAGGNTATVQWKAVSLVPWLESSDTVSATYTVDARTLPIPNITHAAHGTNLWRVALEQRPLVPAASVALENAYPRLSKLLYSIDPGPPAQTNAPYAGAFTCSSLVPQDFAARNRALEPTNQVGLLYDLANFLPEGVLTNLIDADIPPFPRGGFNGPVRDIQVDSLGNIFVVGGFTSYAGEPAKRIAKLLPTGEMDPEFDPVTYGYDGSVNRIELREDRFYGETGDGDDGQAPGSAFVIASNEYSGVQDVGGDQPPDIVMGPPWYGYSLNSFWLPLYSNVETNEADRHMIIRHDMITGEKNPGFDVNWVKTTPYLERYKTIEDIGMGVVDDDEKWLYFTTSHPSGGPEPRNWAMPNPPTPVPGVPACFFGVNQSGQERVQGTKPPDLFHNVGWSFSGFMSFNPMKREYWVCNVYDTSDYGGSVPTTRFLTVLGTGVGPMGYDYDYVAGIEGHGTWWTVPCHWRFYGGPDNGANASGGGFGPAVWSPNGGWFAYGNFRGANWSPMQQWGKTMSLVPPPLFGLTETVDIHDDFETDEFEPAALAGTLNIQTDSGWVDSGSFESAVQVQAKTSLMGRGSLAARGVQFLTEPLSMRYVGAVNAHGGPLWSLVRESGGRDSCSVMGPGNLNEWGRPLAIDHSDNVYITGNFSTIGITNVQHAQALGFPVDENQEWKDDVISDIGTDHPVFNVHPRQLFRYTKVGRFDWEFNTYEHNGKPAFQDENGNAAGIAVVRMQKDGKLLIGGDFTSYKGMEVGRFLRLDPETMKVDLYTGGNNPATVVQFVGEDRTTRGFWKRAYGALARLLPDGSITGSKRVFIKHWGNPLGSTGTLGGVLGLRKIEDPSLPFHGPSNSGLRLLRSDGLICNVDTGTNDAPQAVALYFAFFTHDNYGTVDPTTLPFSIDVYDTHTDTLVDSRTTAGVGTNGLYMVWNLQGNFRFFMRHEHGTYLDDYVSGVFLGGPYDPTPSSALLVATDHNTRGNWIGRYGSEGRLLESGHPDGDVAAGNCVFERGPGLYYNYSGSLAGDGLRIDERAMETSQGGRVYSVLGVDTVNGQWTDMFRMAVPYGVDRYVSFYLYNPWRTGAGLTLRITDLATGQVLSEVNPGNIDDGLYLTFKISGEVRVEANFDNAANARIGGIFWGQPNPAPPPPEPWASYLGEDRATRGNWRGIYGTNGYLLAYGDPWYYDHALYNAMPTNWNYAVQDGVYKGDIWPTGTDATRSMAALQKPTGEERALGAFIATNSATPVTVNFLGPQHSTNRIGLYFVDWQPATNTLTVDILAPDGTNVLDSRQVTNFRGGVYHIWDIAGNFKVRVTGATAPGAFHAIFWGREDTNSAPMAVDGPAAVFVGEDRLTQGEWKGRYGPFFVAHTAASFLGTPTNSVAFTIYPYSGTVPASQLIGARNPDSDARFDSRMSVTGEGVVMVAGEPQHLALYFLNTNADMDVTLRDLDTGDVVDQRRIRNTDYGVWGLWTLHKSVRVQLSTSWNGSPNSDTPYLGALAMGPPIALPPQIAATARYAGSDMATKGNWFGVYASNSLFTGYDPVPVHPGSHTNSLLLGHNGLTWFNNGASSNPLHIQVPTNLVARRDAGFYSHQSSRFSYVQWKSFDPVPRIASFYCTESPGTYALWSKMLIEALDPATKRVLASQWISGITATNGQWVQFEFTGNPVFRFYTPHSSFRCYVRATAAGFADAAPPWCSLLQPGPGTRLLAGATNSVSAEAGSRQAGLDRVEFLANGIPFAACSNAPYAAAWTPAAPGAYSLAAVAHDLLGMASTSAAVTVEAVAPPLAEVRYRYLDRVTQGNWPGTYGGEGFYVAQGAAKNPAYGTITLSGGALGSATAVQTDPRHPWYSDARGTRVNGGYSASGPSGGSASVDAVIAVTDTNWHRIAVYMLDNVPADKGPRTQRIEFYDHASGQLLYSGEPIADLQNGVHAVFEFRGSVRMRLWESAAQNVWLSGLFLGPAAARHPVAAFVSPLANAATRTTNVPVVVSAMSPDGAITNVTVRAPGQNPVELVPSLSGYTGMVSLAAGPATLWAEARDSLGLAVSNYVHVTAHDAPAIPGGLLLRLSSASAQTNAQGAVTNVVDLSGNGLDAVARGTPPLLVAEDNGHPSLVFTNAVSGLEFPNVTWPTASTNGMSFVWIANHADSGDNVGMFALAQAGLQMGAYRSQTLRWGCWGGLVQATVPPAGEEFVVFTYRPNSPSTSDLRIIRNGALLASSSSASSLFNAGPVGPNRLVYTDFGSSRRWFGRLYEFLVFDHVLSSAEIAEIGSLAADVFGAADAPPQHRVTYRGRDHATKGSWPGVYGADGYYVAGSAHSPPLNAGVSRLGTSFDAGAYVWAVNDSSPEAIRLPGQTNGHKAMWSDSTALSYIVTGEDNAKTVFSMYQLADQSSDRHRIEWLDPVSGVALAPPLITTEAMGGIWDRWWVEGSPLLTITKETGNTFPSLFAFGVNPLPQVAITRPTAPLLPADIPLAIDATVEDLDGDIVPPVEMWLNGALAGGDSAAPYSFPFTAVSGTNTVEVRATDNNGNTGVASKTYLGGAYGLAEFERLSHYPQGSWKGRFGKDGYAIASDATSLPTYATFNTTNTATVWSSSTTDARALERAGASTRQAARWQATRPAPVVLNVAISGEPRYVSLYTLDWNRGGENMTVSVKDSATGTVLDTRSYGPWDGNWLTWRVAGSVRFEITSVSSHNPTACGVFFDSTLPGIGEAQAELAGQATYPSGSWRGRIGADGYEFPILADAIPAYVQAVAHFGQTEGNVSSSTTDMRALQQPSPATDRFAARWYDNNRYPAGTTASASGHAFVVDLPTTEDRYVSLYLWDYFNTGGIETVKAKNAYTGEVLASATVTDYKAGQWLTWRARGPILFEFSDSLVLWGVFFDSAPVRPAGTTATAELAYRSGYPFGSWKGRLGADGYDLFGETSVRPPYNPFLQVFGTSDWNAGDPTTDIRGMQYVNHATNRRARYTRANPVARIWVPVESDTPRYVSFFFVDWDNNSRNGTVNVRDANTNELLDSQTVSSYNSGLWLSWLAKGPLVFEFLSSSAYQLTFTGPLFDTTPNLPLDTPASAALVYRGEHPNGSWIGQFGSDGWSIRYDTTSLPPYTPLVYPYSVANVDFVSSSTDPRALQFASGTGRQAMMRRPSGSDRTVRFWVPVESPSAKYVSFYFLDWDNNNRAGTVNVRDAVSGALLDTQVVTNYNNGLWLAWEAKGPLLFEFRSDNPYDLSFDGPFFDSQLPTPAADPPATAVFRRQSEHPQGSWKTNFLASMQGYNLFNDSEQLPPGVPWTWVRGPNSWSHYWPSSTDPRALLFAASTNRHLGVAYQSGTPAPMEVVIPGSAQSRTVSFYFMDPFNQARTSAVTVRDHATEAVLDTRSITNCANGVWLSWTISGPVRFQFQAVNGGGAPLAGFVFGELLPEVPATATFVRSSQFPLGSWKTNFLASVQGYNLFNDSEQLPPGVPWTWVRGPNSWSHTWPSSSDPRALLFTASTNRHLGVAYQSGTPAPMEVVIPGSAQSRTVSFYFMDPFNAARTSAVTVRDHATEAVLDTRAITNCANGVWLSWTISGPVRFQFQAVNGGGAPLAGFVFGDVIPHPATTGSLEYQGRPPMGTWRNWVGTSGSFEFMNGIASYDSSVCDPPLNMGGSWGNLATTTSDLRAPQKLPPATDRTAARYYTYTSMGQYFPVVPGPDTFLSLYHIDWNRYNNVSAEMTVRDAIHGGVIGSTVLTNMADGLWTTWRVNGPVTVEWTKLTGSYVEWFGFAADRSFSPPQNGQAIPVYQGVGPAGSWRGKVGGAGYDVFGIAATNAPYMVGWQQSGAGFGGLANPTSDPRGLEKPDGSGRGVYHYYGYPPSTFDVFMNLNTNTPTWVSFYSVDWGRSGLQYNVRVYDDVTGGLLDSQAVTSYGDGWWLSWRGKGNLRFQFQPVSVYGSFSGIFWDTNAPTLP